MSTATPAFRARAALLELTAGNFIGRRQSAALRQLLAGEEAAWFADRIGHLATTIATMPATHGGDGIARLHYFTRGADWFILERDIGGPDDERDGIPPQSQAYGFADLDGQHGRSHHAEQGYISLPEILEAGAELDLHWEPRSLAAIRKGGAA